ALGLRLAAVHVRAVAPAFEPLASGPGHPSTGSQVAETVTSPDKVASIDAGDAPSEARTPVDGPRRSAWIHVLDEASGTPLPGIEIELKPRTGHGSYVPAEVIARTAPVASGLSGTDGEIRFDDLEPGRYMLTVEHDFLYVTSGDTLDVRTSDLDSPAHHLLLLAAGTRIQGIVLAPSGAPVVGAKVLTNVGRMKGLSEGRQELFPHPLTPGAERTAYTDIHGEYHLDGVPPR